MGDDNNNTETNANEKRQPQFSPERHLHPLHHRADSLCIVYRHTRLEWVFVGEQQIHDIGQINVDICYSFGQ